MNPVDAVTSVAEAAAKAVDFAKIREGRANTPEMQDNAKHQTDQQIADRTNQAIASGNLEELRKLNS